MQNHVQCMVFADGKSIFYIVELLFGIIFLYRYRFLFVQKQC